MLRRKEHYHSRAEGFSFLLVTFLLLHCPGMQCYSVMQSDGDTFCGDFVSDSFNKTSRDEDNILDQIDQGEYVLIDNMMILILHNIIRKCILTLQ